MVDTITYRTTDATRWGGGLGVDLTATQIDINFWVLASQLAAIEDHISNVADIDFFNVVGNLLYVHLTNHVVLGPYTLPTAQWAFKGAWAPLTSYNAYDIVTDANATYMVLQPVTSAATFDPGATVSAHAVYGLLIAAATNAVPAGGTTGQRLGKLSATDFDFGWVSDTRNLAPFFSGKPNASELMLRYVSADVMTLPVGLTGSKGGCGTAPAATTTFTLAKNGAAIGSVIFASGSGNISFDFSTAVTFIPGDVLTILAPATPDANIADISITLQAMITG